MTEGQEVPVVVDNGEPPLEGQTLTTFLKSKLDASPPSATREKFERTYEKLSEAANKIASGYYELLNKEVLILVKQDYIWSGEDSKVNH